MVITAPAGSSFYCCSAAAEVIITDLAVDVMTAAELTPAGSLSYCFSAVAAAVITAAASAADAARHTSTAIKALKKGCTSLQSFLRFLKEGMYYSRIAAHIVIM